jgi:hypothetical protein
MSYQINPDGTTTHTLRWCKAGETQQRWARVVGDPEFALEAAESAWDKLNETCGMITDRPTSSTTSRGRAERLGAKNTIRVR